jgi:2-polyprenyl-6-hydroxyphenyl methylase/3-demethylubiquinone-9 3-methyltransferase
MSDHAIEVRQGERFGFGANWAQFLSVLNEERIEEAKSSLRRMLNVESLDGKTFLDVGSGSGLFSLAARLLGAKVHSFDYDPQSVACTAELKQRYFAGDDDWLVEPGSVLDRQYLSRLGQFDVVYSWGVLHHTGHMWEALENVAPLVKSRGQLFIAIYNDQGRASKMWLAVKKVYNLLPSWLHVLVLIPSFFRLWLPTIVRDLLSGHPSRRWKAHVKERGMSPWRDVVDWVGGYPFEVARPEEIFDFYGLRGFRLTKLKTCAGGFGCNEFVFWNG